MSARLKNGIAAVGVSIALSGGMLFATEATASAATPGPTASHAAVVQVLGDRRCTRRFHRGWWDNHRWWNNGHRRWENRRWHGPFWDCR
ncbi:MAG TPA: hypothetical protein VGH89_31695 [Pseudonocardia sp.]|jgi:hypothetical protein